MIRSCCKVQHRQAFIFATFLTTCGVILFVVNMSVVYINIQNELKNRDSYTRDTCTTQNFTIRYFTGVGNVFPTSNMIACISWQNVVLFECTDISKMTRCMEENSAIYRKSYDCFYKSDCEHVIFALENPDDGIFILILFGSLMLCIIGIIFLSMSLSLRKTPISHGNLVETIETVPETSV